MISADDIFLLNTLDLESALLADLSTLVALLTLCGSVIAPQLSASKTLLPQSLQSYSWNYALLEIA